MILNEETSLILGHQSLTGLQSDVSFSYLAVKTQTDFMNIQRGQLGFIVTSNSIGDVINKNTAQFHFSKRIKIKDNLDLGIGTDVGLLNLFFKSTALTSGGSDFGLNLDIMARIKWNNLVIGISNNRITKPRLLVLNTILFADPYYSTISSYKALLTPELTLWTHMQLLYGRAINGLSLSYKNTLVINNQYEAGVGVNETRLNLHLGLTNISFIKFNYGIDFLLAYEFPMLTGLVIPQDRFQIHIQIRPGK